MVTIRPEEAFGLVSFIVGWWGPWSHSTRNIDGSGVPSASSYIPKDDCSYLYRMRADGPLQFVTARGQLVPSMVARRDPELIGSRS